MVEINGDHLRDSCNGLPTSTRVDVTSNFEHRGDQFGWNGTSPLLLALLGVREVGQHADDSLRGRSSTGVYKDKHLHAHVVDNSTAALDNINIGPTNRLQNRDVGFLKKSEKFNST